MCWPVKTVDFNEVKRQEAQSRMSAVRKARRSRVAAKLQHRASLVGDGTKWRITKNRGKGYAGRGQETKSEIPD